MSSLLKAALGGGEPAEPPAAAPADDGAEDPPALHHSSSSWMVENHPDRPPEDPESPFNPERLSRMSTGGIESTLEEVELDMIRSREEDAAAGVQRPDGWLKLGGKLPFKVARAPVDLTPAWMTTVLRFRKLLTPDATVEDVSVKPIGEGGGVMGVICLVNLVYSDNAPSTAPRKMVAKFSPQGKAPLPKFVVRAVFKAESHFYNDFTIADGGLSRPQCYLALYDQKRRNPTFCMLLEDMMPAVAFTRIAPPLADDAEKLTMAAATLAKMHARWWGHPKKAPLDWVLHPSQDFGGLMLNGFLRTTKVGIACLSKVYGEVYEPVVAMMPLLRRRHKYILETLFAPPLTLTHGDAHIENVFYDARFSGGCAFIDFGNMMYSQGCFDLAFFMCHSIDVETRRATEERVVKAYHASLVANGVDAAAYTYDRCWFDYKFNVWKALISILAMGPNIEQMWRRKKGIFAESPSKGDAMLKEMYEKLNERCIAALLDHKWLDLVLEGDTYCGVCSCCAYAY